MRACGSLVRMLAELSSASTASRPLDSGRPLDTKSTRRTKAALNPLGRRIEVPNSIIRERIRCSSNEVNAKAHFVSSDLHETTRYGGKGAGQRGPKS